MLTAFSRWILIATLGQAPAPSEAVLLKAAPAEVDVAIRVRGLEAARDDVVAMVKEMNAEWGNVADGVLAGQLDEIKTRHGARAVASPLLVVARLGEEGGEGGPPPFAALLPSDDYKGTLKEFNAGADVELKPQVDGYDAFDGPGGHGTWYAVKGPGVVAFGTSKALIAEIAKRGKTLDSVLSGAAAKSFAAGDIGVYVNAASLTQKYRDQIDQGRQSLMGLLDQAGQQGGNAGAMDAAKDLYAGLFDALKYADGLTLNLDAGGKGLHLAGFLKVKPGSDAAKSLATVHTGDVAALGKLPPGAMVYSYMNVGAKTFDRFQGMNLKMIAGKPSPELEKATAQLHALGRLETLGSVSMDKGMVTLTEIKADDPAKYLEARLAILRAMGGGEGRPGIYKDLKIEPDAQKLGGLTFTHSVATINMENLTKLSGNNPAQVESLKSIFGDGTMNAWYGSDGKRSIDVVAPNWEAARGLVEAYLKGDGGIGRTEGFKAVTSELPARTGFVMAFSMQGLVKMMAKQLAAITKNPDLKAPDDLPREPAYVAFALTPEANAGYEFHLVVPGAAGPVIAEGLLPVLQGMGAAGANR